MRKMDYNKTLKLPKTAFPMRGNLPKREPDTITKWEENKLYEKMIARNEGKKPFILHDGPPYANGQIHLGTALNKILKDFIIKYKNMTGFYAPYVPGWDTHGLPIELKALKAKGVDKTKITPVELRKDCADFALQHVENQKKQFKRLGSLGKYDKPYLTLRHEYEARQIEVFGKMAEDGYLYKGLKPVYWCPDCDTALAEAEIEYNNDPCKSIYVKFAVNDDKGVFADTGIDKSKIFFVIWTTTTWTIPGNLAICLGPEYDYTLVNANGEYYVMVAELVPSVMKAAGIEDYSTTGSFKGSDLEGIRTQHPLYDRESPVIVGDHVTLESGTGCVHTAPGYGVDDFEVCKKYDDIGIIVCVDSKGRQTKEAGEFEGLDTDEANKAIFAKLESIGALFASEDIVHQYYLNIKRNRYF
jgi:isoleucyl-tRNA synthetase